MKSLFDRIVGGTASPSSGAADDQGFFSTQFLERPEALRTTSAWMARSLGVGAHAMPAAEGFASLERVWGHDHFFASLDTRQRQILAGHLQYVTVPGGRELIVQEEKGDYALIVLEGVVAVDRLQPAGGRARLAEAREGDVLGEMSLIDAGARFASCITLGPCKLAVLTGDSLDDLAVEEPRLGMAVLASIARRLSLRTRQLSARLGALLASG